MNRSLAYLLIGPLLAAGLVERSRARQQEVCDPWRVEGRIARLADGTTLGDSFARGVDSGAASRVRAVVEAEVSADLLAFEKAPLSTQEAGLPEVRRLARSAGTRGTWLPSSQSMSPATRSQRIAWGRGFWSGLPDRYARIHQAKDEALAAWLVDARATFSGDTFFSGDLAGRFAVYAVHRWGASELLIEQVGGLLDGELERIRDEWLALEPGAKRRMTTRWRRSAARQGRDTWVTSMGQHLSVERELVEGIRQEFLEEGLSFLAHLDELDSSFGGRVSTIPSLAAFRFMEADYGGAPPDLVRAHVTGELVRIGRQLEDIARRGGEFQMLEAAWLRVSVEETLASQSEWIPIVAAMGKNLGLDESAMKAWCYECVRTLRAVEVATEGPSGGGYQLLVERFHPISTWRECGDDWLAFRAESLEELGLMASFEHPLSAPSLTITRNAPLEVGEQAAIADLVVLDYLRFYEKRVTGVINALDDLNVDEAKMRVLRTLMAVSSPQVGGAR